MEQEQEHLDTFDTLLNEYKVRPSLLDPVWSAAGFVLGATTAAMGPKAAMACTIAVEEVIGTHYDRQVQDLKNRRQEPELVKTLARLGMKSWNTVISQLNMKGGKPVLLVNESGDPDRM